MKHLPDSNPKIGVIPMGEAPEIAAKVVAAHIAAFFGLAADVMPRRPLPQAALDRGRLQYDAGSVLSYLDGNAPQGCDKVIGVLNVDLFIPIFAYVIGEARQGGRCGLVSLYRLDDEPSNPSRLLERCAKVALHELGHLLNLTHCSDPYCLMHLSGDSHDLDKQRLNLCRYCRLCLVSPRVGA